MHLRCDPGTISPDPVAAREAMQAAEFTQQRLHTLLPRLTQRHAEVLGQEKYQNFVTSFNAVAAKHATAVAVLTEAAQALPKLIEAFALARSVDAEVQRVMQNKPKHLQAANGDNKHLLPVECTARGVAHIAPEFSLLNLKLSFSDPTQLDWPPAQTPESVQFVQNMTVPAGAGPEWWKGAEERKAQAVNESKRVADYYARQQHEKEAREAQEAKAARAARQR